MPDQVDVVVVGAGPAGSTAATLLARRGHRVVLVDRAHFPRAKACAEYLSPGVVGMLDHLDLPIFRHHPPKRVPGMDILSPRGTSMRLQYRHDGQAVSACTLPRRTFDAAMLAEAIRSGVEMEEGFVVRSPIWRDGIVRGVHGTGKSGPRDISARLSIIADGCRSHLAAALGLASPALWPVRLGLVAHYEGRPNLRDGFGQMHVTAGGYCGIAPLPAGRINVAVVARADSLRRSGGTPAAYLDRWIEASPSLRATLEGCRRVTPIRGMLPVGSRSKRSWAPGVLLVGDAASFFDPFTGEGIYRALHGAEIAADVGHQALISGDVSATVLSEYGLKRRQAFRRKEMVTALVQLFVHYPRLMEYALPRLSHRSEPIQALSLVLGDMVEAGQFLNARMLWSTLRP